MTKKWQSTQNKIGFIVFSQVIDIAVHVAIGIHKSVKTGEKDCQQMGKVCTRIQSALRRIVWMQGGKERKREKG